MSDYIYTTEGELMHYGVPGMKWGVRRNARLLSMHQRNQAMRLAKKDYKSGKISKQQKKTAIKNAKSQQKNEYKKLVSSVKDSESRKSLANKTLKTVPHSRIKKGATMVNKLITGVYLGGTAGSLAAATAINPAIGGLSLAALAAQGAVQAGRQIVTQKILDRIA